MDVAPSPVQILLENVAVATKGLIVECSVILLAAGKKGDHPLLGTQEEQPHTLPIGSHYP